MTTGSVRAVLDSDETQCGDGREAKGLGLHWLSVGRVQASDLPFALDVGDFMAVLFVGSHTTLGARVIAYLCQPSLYCPVL